MAWACAGGGVLKVFMLDTHVHTCLSPCGDLDMHPSGLVAAARAARLDAVGVCDHNSARNVAATMRAGARAGLTVVPGMEIASEEEVHVLAFLPDVEAAERLQQRVYDVLPGKNDAAAFGEQVVADEHGEVVALDDRLLIGATQWSVDEVVRAIHEVDGLAIAAHVDRERFGLLGQLGFVPPGLALDAIEVSRRTTMPEARARFGALGFPIVTASDAHEPKDIGAAVTLMLLERIDHDEVRRALEGRNGRAVLGGGRPMDDLALHVLDIAQNALDAGATRVEIELVEDLDRDLLTIEVRDNGRGMPSDVVAKASDPFYTTRTTRKVGMGLSLLGEAARAAGGGLTIESAPGEGTRVRVRFQHAHVDRAPVGDLEGTLMALMAGRPDVDVRFRHLLDDREFSVSSREIALELHGRSVQSPEGLTLLRQTIRRGEASLAARPMTAKRE